MARDTDAEEQAPPPTLARIWRELDGDEDLDDILEEEARQGVAR